VPEKADPTKAKVNFGTPTGQPHRSFFHNPSGVILTSFLTMAHTLVGLNPTLVRSVELVSTLFFAERHPQGSVIQNFRHKLQMITSEFDEDSLPQRIPFLPVPHPYRGEVPENASPINRSICDDDATKRPKARRRITRTRVDVSEVSVIPRTRRQPQPMLGSHPFHILWVGELRWRANEKQIGSREAPSILPPSGGA
jgi:hypothetical protein